MSQGGLYTSRGVNGHPNAANDPLSSLCLTAFRSEVNVVLKYLWEVRRQRVLGETLSLGCEALKDNCPSQSFEQFSEVALALGQAVIQCDPPKPSTKMWGVSAPTSWSCWTVHFRLRNDEKSLKNQGAGPQYFETFHLLPPTCFFCRASPCFCIQIFRNESVMACENCSSFNWKSAPRLFS